MKKFFHRKWQIYIAIIITGIVTFATGWRPMSAIFYALLFSTVIAVFFILRGTSGLRVNRSNTPARIQSGETIAESIILENRSWLPKLWAQINDDSTLPGHEKGYVTSIGARKRIEWRLRTLCSRRGRYQLGPVRITTGDPLGLYQRTQILNKSAEILVLPKILPIKDFPLFPGQSIGRGKNQQRTQQVSTNVVTLREYLPGDPLSRIHWPISVRQSQLMVKEFELDPTIDIWLMLDMDENIQAGEGDISTVEYSVTITASLAQYFIRSDLSVGFIINDSQKTVLPPDRGRRQNNKIMDLLAIAAPCETMPLKVTLAAVSSILRRNSSVIIVTSSIDLQITESAQNIMRHGVKPYFVALDSASFMNSGSESEPFLHSLRLSNIPFVHIRKDSDIIHALETGVLS